MKMYPKEADYAVQALIYLSMREDKEEFLSVTQLARELKVPLNYLRRICSTLTRFGYLETREGAGGGVRVIRKPEKIHLLGLIEIFQGSPKIAECKFRKKLCPNRGRCVVRRRILRIEEMLAEKFKKITIRMLINDIRKENITSSE